MGQIECQFLSDPMSDRKNKFSPTLRNIYKKTAWCTTLRGENTVNFLCTPKRRVRGYIAPPKMKVKGYMYPEMKKPVGMLPKSRTLSRTSDTTETRNPCVIKVILLACFTCIDIF